MLQAELPIQTKLQGDIQETSIKLEAMEQRLSELNCFLDKERKNKEDLNRRLQVNAGILSRRRNEVGELREKNELGLQLLEAKERELRCLQRLLKKERKDKKELKDMVLAKEEEITKLQESLQKQKAKIKKAGQEAQSLRDELQRISTELAMKIFQLQEMEQSRKELRNERDRERRRVDCLVVQGSVAGDMDAYKKEIQVGVVLMKSTVCSLSTTIL